MVRHRESCCICGKQWWCNYLCFELDTTYAHVWRKGCVCKECYISGKGRNIIEWLSFPESYKRKPPKHIILKGCYDMTVEEIIALLMVD